MWWPVSFDFIPNAARVTPALEDTTQESRRRTTSAGSVRVSEVTVGRTR
jgi:hypothetical protein